MPGSTKTQPWKAVWPATESEATGGDDQKVRGRLSGGQYCGKFGYTGKGEDTASEEAASE